MRGPEFDPQYPHTKSGMGHVFITSTLGRQRLISRALQFLSTNVSLIGEFHQREREPVSKETRCTVPEQ